MQFSNNKHHCCSCIAITVPILATMKTPWATTSCIPCSWGIPGPNISGDQDLFKFVIDYHRDRNWNDNSLFA